MQLHCKYLQHQNAACISEISTKCISSPFPHLALSFVGAPCDAHEDTPLHYLGDVEISEDATLAELKSQVRPLPAADLSAGLVSSREMLTCSSVSCSLEYSLLWRGMCLLPCSGKGPAGNRHVAQTAPSTLFCRWPWRLSLLPRTGLLCFHLSKSAVTCRLCSFLLSREM